MMYVVYLVDAYKYIATVLFYGLLLISTIGIMRLFGLSPLVVVGLVAPAPSSAATPSPAHIRHHALAATAVATTLPAAPLPIPTPTSAATMWPLHGMVTTQYGASDLPYQRVHTGIDISDGKPSGVSNVVAFRGGRVFQPSAQFYGYGNLVAIDHGNGLTSYYGHLASKSVSVGQTVNAGNVIGKEGSTGNSTGPHVHFEVRVNNAPVNPRGYVSGNP